MTVDLAPGSGPSTAFPPEFATSSDAAFARVSDAFEAVAVVAAWDDAVSAEESYISAVPVVNTGRP
ncbi:hypothetical protein [Streptomyces sp. 3214.6]|uniref:hypothetical protein n=1 Tax=Streptomyces sp. 3214.6 TaxID=1882757 RepID=UPI00117D7E05|nr:hypothetical protein [Streptomyces sp. 3214.6]